MSTAADFNSVAKPEFITGGCLCGSIRYRVDFPKDHDFEKSSGSCQCTQCRRQTGALVSIEHAAPLSCFRYTTGEGPSAAPPSPLKIFSATPGIHRGFCGECGSTLYWRRAAEDEIGIMAGTIDPEFLFGEGGKFSKALVGGGGPHCYCENEIPGVTDDVGKESGVRYQKGASGPKML